MSAGLVALTYRRDGLSGTAYCITLEGQRELERVMRR